MATLIRSAKSGSNWAPNDLRAFNIQVIRQDAPTFFGQQELPIPQNISPIIWNNVAAPPGIQLSKVEQHFFAYLEDAMRMPPGEESLVDDFAVFLLSMLDYDNGYRVVHTRKEMSFYMCGSRVDAKADVTVIERRGPLFQYILLVQEDKRYQSGEDPEPQVIAEAIAAFHQNNRTRDSINLPPLESHIFPAITLVGTAATFYKITITRDLLFAVEGGAYPLNATIVHKFVPSVPDLVNYAAVGMIPLENRRILLQCFEAFKQFLLTELFHCRVKRRLELVAYTEC
ncbi:hypothetical protein BDQ12DRAFT_712739 [Crucibulum laeve]|uniref:Uncharacterized protein n=1 Tax=Crucibulum laeve TaxID=68775 RepID=A0A5C3M0U2_9AGAR|nr:hypothetical protein BDQ12DRAFT_712739 [Crucibulum laeve]